MGGKYTSRLGIQSWCFRKYDTAAELLPDLKRCGVNHLEICGKHVDIVNKPEVAIEACRAAGVTISSFGVHGFGADEAGCRKAFEFAVMADIPVMSANIDFDALPMLERLCDEYGKKLAHHNHGRKHFTGSVRMIEELVRRTSPNIGLCLDTAWMLDSGEDPLEVAKKFQSRLYGVHLKDFVFDRAGHPEDVITGTGNLKLHELAGFLKEIDYRGYLTIEFEGDKDDPVPALQCCVSDVKRAFGEVPVK